MTTQQTVVMVINIILLAVTLLGGFKYLVKSNLSVELALKEVKEIKLITNDHALQINAIKNTLAYEKGIQDGRSGTFKRHTGG